MARDGYTKFTVEVQYPDANYEYSYRVDAWDMNIEDVFEAFRRLAIDMGFSEETVKEYFDPPGDDEGLKSME